MRARLLLTAVVAAVGFVALATKTYSYSVLRTIQDGLGLGPYLGSAANIGPLPVVWK